MASLRTPRLFLSSAERTLLSRSSQRLHRTFASYSAVSASLSTGPSTSSHRPRLNENRAEISRWIQRRTMFIQTETTPNADSLKFIPGSPVSTSGTHEFLTAAAASVSPLADSLFNLPGVSTVFFGPDFISVNKEDGVEWSDLKPEIYSLIMENFSAGTPLFREGSEGDGEGPEDTRILDTDSEVVAMLKELLDTRVRPTIQQDGGDIEYKGFEEDTGKVFLMLKGSCRGCSSSAGTLKLGIERMLMHYIPEVKEVEQVEAPEEKVAEDAFAKFEERLRGGKTITV